MSTTVQNIEYTKKDLPARNYIIGIVLLLIGAGITVASFMVDPQRASFDMIILLMFITGVGFGALFMVALEFLAGAVWSTPFRRITEMLAAVIFIAPFIAIPIIMNMDLVYEWTHDHIVQHDPFLKNKVPYLNEPFFLMRSAGVFLFLWLFYMLIIGRSRKQDVTKDPGLTKGLIRRSGLFMPIFAIGITLFAIDWMMTLEPHWFSTIYGVYYFAGSLLSALALSAFISMTLSEAGYLHKSITRDHYYSYGALMFAFTNFWAYIGFSQLILIWYANIPEETFWYMDRWQGTWAFISLALILVKFGVPYALLLTQPSKSNPLRLKIAAIWILVAHFYDLYWLIMPTYSKMVGHHAIEHGEATKDMMKEYQGIAYFGWQELALPLIIIGVLLVVFNFMAKRSNLIPVGDPKLVRGLKFHL